MVTKEQSAGLPRAAALDTVRVAMTVFAPLVASGVVLRRRRVDAVADRLDLDRRVVRLLQRLRARYGAGPLRMRLVGRSVALMLAPRDGRRVDRGGWLLGALSPFRLQFTATARAPARHRDDVTFSRAERDDVRSAPDKGE